MISKTKVFLTRITRFFSGNVDEDVLLTLAKTLDGVKINEITVDQRLRNSIATYSNSLVELSKWIVQSNAIMAATEYIPPAWVKNQNVLSEQPLDTYMLNGGFSYDIVLFIEGLRKEILEHLELLNGVEVSEARLQAYYSRQYQPIIHDIEVVLRLFNKLT